jgi:hypothetical protein
VRVAVAVAAGVGAIIEVEIAASVSARRFLVFRRRRLWWRLWNLARTLHQNPLFGHARTDEGVFAVWVQPGAAIGARAL